MDHLKLIVILSVATVLTACGGGGSSDPAPTQITPAPTTPTTAKPIDPPKTTYYTPAAPRTGDSYSYSINRVVSGFVPYVTGLSTYTLQVGQVAADGSFYRNRYENGELVYNALLDSQHNLVRQNGCNFAPAVDELPAPFYVGQTFSQNSTATCGAFPASFFGSPLNVSANSHVLAYEPISVAAGKFNTLKIKGDFTITYNSGVVSTESETCWVDVVSGATVKCDEVITYDYAHNINLTLSVLAGAGKSTETSSVELTSIKHAPDFLFSLGARVDGVVIPSVYLTPIEKQPLYLAQGKTLTLNSSDVLGWSIVGSGTTDTPIALANGNQVVLIDGYSVRISIMGGQLTAKVLTLPPSGVATFTLTGSALIDLNQNVAITVYSTADQTSPEVPTSPNCSYTLKFC